VLDIAIVAWLIYWFLGFVRATNTTNVIKGIFLVIAVMWLSKVLNLTVISYLLGGTFEMGVIILIMVFQPEVRHFLEQMGGGKLLSLGARQSASKMVETAVKQVVLACTDLSRSKTGALIVFERGNPLDSYIRTGTVIDAEPAADLLENIFFVNTPLHDGAVIIRKGRITAAACMLPLTSNSNISRQLGMRHRAGIGISERSDAVVVIVSEETGTISVACEGMLKRHLSSETLELLLRGELLSADSGTESGKFLFWKRKPGKEARS
jgi:diadenylate cyclase